MRISTQRRQTLINEGRGRDSDSDLDESNNGGGILRVTQRLSAEG